jgi:glycosyltransferase involved in cell wall biosynthesis
MSTLGGPSHSLLKLLKYLKKDHELAVVAPGNGELFEILENIGVTGYRAESQGLTVGSIPWLCRIIRNGNYDLVYGNNYSSGPRNALIAAKLCRKPFIWHIREMLWKTRLQTSFFLRYADVIIAVSRASAQSLEYYVPQKKVHIIYNGVDLEEFQVGHFKARQYVHRVLEIPEEYPVIVSVGQIGLRKGQKYTIEAAAQVVKDCPTAIFAIIGKPDGELEYASDLNKLVFHRGLDKNVRFLGFRSDIAMFLEGSDIFLHTALRDPNPRAILEAMAARLPVVAFGVDGVCEQVIDGETGYLVVPQDTMGAARALLGLLNSPDLRSQMGEKALKRVAGHFTSETIASAVVALIEEQMTHRPYTLKR